MVDQKQYFGIYIGRVTEVDIPEFKDYGAVRVSLPQVMMEDIGKNNDDTVDLDKHGLIAFPANNPLGGRDPRDKVTTEHFFQGCVYIPPLGSLVLVFFMDGDLDRPFYMGALNQMYSKLPPEQTSATEPHKVYTILKTHAGRTVVVSDDTNTQRVEITGKKRTLSGSDPAGNESSTYTVTGNQTTILLDEREGKEQLLIMTHKGDYFRIDITNRKLNINFESDINIKTNGNFSVEAKKKIHMKSTDNMQLETTKQLNMKAGLGIGITGGSSMHMNSTGGIIRIDGSRVYVNSGIQMQASASSPIVPVGARDL